MKLHNSLLFVPCIHTLNNVLSNRKYTLTKKIKINQQPIKIQGGKNNKSKVTPKLV